MQAFLGIIAVIVCVFGSYIGMGGHLHVLWQPLEFVIIAGAAFGAFIIGNTKSVFFASGKALTKAFKKSQYNKQAYIELLVMLQKLFKVMSTKGILELERHVENPFESDLFRAYPTFIKNKKTVIFLTDTLRFMMMGCEHEDQLAAIMDEDLASLKRERAQVVAGIHNASESLPAIGIVAAVLGVIKTMGAMTEPPAVLGKMMGAALVGTFLGVYLSYGFVGPLSRKVSLCDAEEMQYYQCIKEALLSHAAGIPPALAVEHARKTLLDTVRPTFFELDEAIQKDKAS